MAYTEYLLRTSHLGMFSPSDIRVSEKPQQHLQDIYQASPVVRRLWSQPAQYTDFFKGSATAQVRVWFRLLSELSDTEKMYLCTSVVAAEHRAGSQEYSVNSITPPGASLTWKCRRRTAQDSNNEKSLVKASSNLWWREGVHLASPSAHNSKRGESFWTIYVNYLNKWGAIRNRLPRAKIHSRSVEMADA